MFNSLANGVVFYSNLLYIGVIHTLVDLVYLMVLDKEVSYLLFYSMFM